MGAVCGEGRVRSGDELHAVGDGAPWIANQVDLQFGTQGSYLVDFFHVGEYLGAAASVCAPDHPQAWLDVQQERLKANQAPAVLDALAPFVSANDDDPVTACDRYLRNRLHQLDYQGAIQRGLPIGSGKSRALTATLSKNGSSSPAPGGRPIISKRCWRSG